MRPSIRRGLSAALAVLSVIVTAACTQPTPPEPGERPKPLLLISIDGARHDYLDHADTPAIDRLIESGLIADSMQHVFPTKTFPTHYSLVTGRHPGTHGVVANSMWDPRRDRNERFSLGNREAVEDGYWYQGGEPIWVTAQAQGLTAATFFWPGSEARIHRIRPSFWKPYAGDTPHAERIAQILDWLDKPAAERPDLLTLYFSRVDSTGHRHGPLAEPVIAALEDVDRHLGDLLDGLDQRGLLGAMNILLVADHGMSRVDLDRYIMLDDYLDLGGVRVSDWGPAAQIWATDTSVEEIMAALEDAHPRMRVWRREDIPARYHFGDHHRVPDVLAEADPEWMISNKPYMAGRERFSLQGMHGWDPAFEEMHGIFVAHGPAFEGPKRAPAVRSIDLYALMTELLALEPADHEGSMGPWQPYLESTAAPEPERFTVTCPTGPTRFSAALGPGHMSLGHERKVFVLERSADDAGRRFHATGMAFELDGEQATVRIDETTWHDCRVEPAAVR